LQLARSWLAPGASGWLDPSAEPDSGLTDRYRAIDTGTLGTVSDTDYRMGAHTIDTTALSAVWTCLSSRSSPLVED